MNKPMTFEWHKWSESRPTMGNERGFKFVNVEFASGDMNIWFIPNLANKNFDEDVAWCYIVPSGFKMEEKSNAELAWEKWVAFKCPIVAKIPVSRIGDITKESFIELYEFNLGAAETKGRE